MLTLRDCLDFADWDEADLAAVARHQHLPMMIAAQLSQHLTRTGQSETLLARVLAEEVRRIQFRGNRPAIAALAADLADRGLQPGA